MTVSVASFVSHYPEFAKAGDPMLAAQLIQAEFEVSDSFGDARDTAVMLRLADMLASSPWGRDARTNKVATTTYGERFRRLAEANAVSASRLGAGSGLGPWTTSTIDGDG